MPLSAPCFYSVFFSGIRIYVLFLGPPQRNYAVFKKSSPRLFYCVVEGKKITWNCIQHLDICWPLGLLFILFLRYCSLCWWWGLSQRMRSCSKLYIWNPNGTLLCLSVCPSVRLMNPFFVCLFWGKEFIIVFTSNLETSVWPLIWHLCLTCLMLSWLQMLFRWALTQNIKALSLF